MRRKMNRETWMGGGGGGKEGEGGWDKSRNPKTEASLWGATGGGMEGGRMMWRRGCRSFRIRKGGPHFFISSRARAAAGLLSRTKGAQRSFHVLSTGLD